MIVNSRLVECLQMQFTIGGKYGVLALGLRKTLRNGGRDEAFHDTLLFKLLIVAGCTTTTRPGVAITPNGPEKPNSNALRLSNPLDNQSGSESPYTRFVRLYELSAAHGAATQMHQSMLDAGLSYGDLLCDRYFNAIANRNQDLNFSRDAAGLGAGFVASVLGITESSTKSVALVAAGFTATIAGMESYQQHYYFGPRVATIRKFISEGQKSYQAEITAEMRNELTHETALEFIRANQAICQVDAIQSFVDQAVSQQEIVFETTARNKLLGDAEISILRGELQRALRAPVVTVSEIPYLYWLVELGADADEIEHVIVKGLSPSVSSTIISSNAIDTAKLTEVINVQRAFATLTEETKKEIAAQAQNLKVATQRLAAEKGGTDQVGAAEVSAEATGSKVIRGTVKSSDKNN